VNGPHQGCHEVNWERVIATSPPDMVNTDAMATVFPTVTSSAVAAPALVLCALAHHASPDPAAATLTAISCR